MIFDWFHRKFYERLLECENGGLRYPTIDKPLKAQSLRDHTEHRYRYFIPEANSNENIINLAITTENNSAIKEEEIKTETKPLQRTCHSELSHPELLKRIKKFYIITSDKKTEEDVMKLSSSLIKGIYSSDIRKFLVLPLHDDENSDSGNSGSDLNVHLHDQSKQDDEIDNASNLYDNTFEMEDLDGDFDDIFEEEGRYSSSRKTENIRHSLITEPLDRYNKDTWRIFKKQKTSISPTTGHQMGKIGTKDNEIKQKTDQRKLLIESESDLVTWGDLVDTDVPITCQSLRSKLKESGQVPETSAFRIIFNKFFKSKSPKNYNNYGFETFKDNFEEEYRSVLGRKEGSSTSDCSIIKPLKQLDTLDHSTGAIVNKTEQNNGMRNLWRQSEIDGSWWCDLMDTEVPVTCQSLQFKLKELKVKEINDNKSIFEKIFKTNNPEKENYNEFEFHSRFID